MSMSKAGDAKSRELIQTVSQISNGLMNEVSIQNDGLEKVPTERGIINANKYTYTGQLETTVWYDKRGRWVKMEFFGKDGSTITYRCKKCQGL